MRYVEFALLQLGTSDQAFHNLAVALYALQPEEGPLLAYLARAQGPLGSPLYDASHALRLARSDLIRLLQRPCHHPGCHLPAPPLPASLPPCSLPLFFFPSAAFRKNSPGLPCLVTHSCKALGLCPL